VTADQDIAQRDTSADASGPDAILRSSFLRAQHNSPFEAPQACSRATQLSGTNART